MISIYCIVQGSLLDITSLCKSVKISGTDTNVCRSLQLDLAYGIYDTNLPRIKLPAGTLVWALLDTNEVFRGKVIDDKLSQDDNFNATIYDFAWYLKKNKVTFNFQGITPQDATLQILKKLGIEAHEIYSSSVTVNRLLAQQTAYDAIMEMYTQDEKQTGNKYYLYAYRDKVNVALIGSYVSSVDIKPSTGGITADGNLISFVYEESIDNMINRIEVYDSNNNLIDTVNGDAYKQNYYGVLADSYKVEKDKDYKTVTSTMLHDIDITLQCSVYGNYTEFFTGNAVKVTIPWIDTLASGVTMYVREDNHTWDIATGTYISDLKLSFTAVMDEKEYASNTDASSGSSDSDSTSGDANSVVAYAKQFIGLKYVWGGTDLSSGVDCSGFVQQVFAHFGVNLPRTTYEQIQCGSSVSESELQPGDLVFPSTGHVQIYVGDGKVIHAPHTGSSVCIINMYGFYAGRRVM